MRSVVRLPLASWLAVLTLAFAPAAQALDTGDIHVLSVKGEVRATQGAGNAGERALRAGTVLELPATVRTGSDGAVELRQGKTTVSVAPGSVLEFPALEKRGAPIDRVLQPRGNAFYDVGRRDGRKLRVETPFLVAVIKGTQFNVAAQDDATTISLFEGQLEIRAPDDSAVIDLRAGEIASRRRGDKDISVIEMDAKAAPRTPPAANTGGPSAPTPGTAPSAPRGHIDNGDSLVAGRSGARGSDPDISGPAAGAAASDGLTTALDTGASSGVNVAGVGAEIAAGANVSVAAGGVDVRAPLSTGVDAGQVAVGVDTGASVGATGNGIDIGSATSASVDAGAVSVAVGTNAGVDVTPTGVSVDVGAGAAVDTGTLAADVAGGAGIDLGNNGRGANVAVDVDVTPGAGPARVDVRLNTGVDIGAPGPAATVDVDVGANVRNVGADVTAGANPGAGQVDLGANLGTVGVDLGIDLGLDDADTGADSAANDTNDTNDTTTTDGGTIVDDVGGLLDSLLRRPRGK